MQEDRIIDPEDPQLNSPARISKSPSPEIEKEKEGNEDEEEGDDSKGEWCFQALHDFYLYFRFI